MRPRFQAARSRESPSLCDRAAGWLPRFASGVDDGELRGNPANGRGAAALVGRIARTTRPHRCAVLILIAIVGNDSDGRRR